MKDQFMRMWWRCGVRVINAGLAELRGNYQRQRRARDMWTLYVLFDGHLQLEFAQHALQVTGPVAYLVRPQEPFLERATNKPVHLFVANYHIICEAGARNPFEDLQHPSPLPLTNIDWWLEHCTASDACFTGFRLGSLDLAVQARHSMDLMLTEWLKATRSLQPEAAATSPGWLRSLVEFIVANAKDSQLDHPRLVKESGVTASHLNHMFNQYYDTSPLRFLRRERMRLAARLLESRIDDPISMIAQDSGYTNSALFTRHFTKAHGQSPRAYRQALIRRSDAK